MKSRENLLGVSLRWRRQSVYKRRLQVMLALFVSSFFAFMLAVSLRGEFIVVFGINITFLLFYLYHANKHGKELLMKKEFKGSPVAQRNDSIIGVPTEPDALYHDEAEGLGKFTSRSNESLPQTKLESGETLFWSADQLNNVRNSHLQQKSKTQDPEPLPRASNE